MKDPNPLVSGKGIAILEEAGLEVCSGILEKECRQLNQMYLKWITTGLPFVALKTAMTLDGKIATVTGKSQWITNEASRLRVHELRDRYDGILAGIGTVLADDPSLTARLPDGMGKNPVRIVADSLARIPLQSRLLHDRQAPVLIAVTEQAPKERLQALRELGAEVLQAGQGPHVNLPLLMKQLGDRGLLSVFVEGGGTLNFSLLQEKLVDQVYAFIAPKVVGGRAALSPVEGDGFAELSEAIELDGLSAENLQGDILLTGYVKNSSNGFLF